MEIFKFNGDPCKWSDFIQTLTIERIIKRNFTDDIRMGRLLSVLDGEFKRIVISISRNGLFYAIAMKKLKSNWKSNGSIIFKTKISFRSPLDYYK